MSEKKIKPETNKQTMNNVTFTEYFMNCVIVSLLFVKHVWLYTQKARTIKCVVNCLNQSMYISLKHLRFSVNMTIKCGKGHIETEIHIFTKSWVHWNELQWCFKIVSTFQNFLHLNNLESSLNQNYQIWIKLLFCTELKITTKMLLTEPLNSAVPFV